MPDVSRRRFGFHLAWLLSVAVTGAFVTALIITTRDLQALWPLYIVPIVIAAITYHVAGALVTSAIVTAAIALLVYAGGFAATPALDIVAGMTAFVVTGVVIGVQTHRYEEQRELAERDSVHDPLTGTFMLAHFESLLHTETRRCERYGQRLAFALIEVADFEAFARKFGRPKADLLLGRVAAVMRLTLRDTDSIGRFGPSMFAVMLTQADPETAVSILARVTTALEMAEFEGDALEPVTHCRVIVGAAYCPDDAATPESLVAHALSRLGGERTSQQPAPSSESRAGNGPPRASGGAS